jgi:hypothetical protein
MGWIELFPFSDNPAKLHDAIPLLPEPHRQPYAFDRLLEARIAPQALRSLRFNDSQPIIQFSCSDLSG